jgi:hypothetical protein
MKKSVYGIVFIVALGFQTNVSAETFNYSKISLGYLDTTVGMGGVGADLTASGYNLTAAVEMNKSFGVQFGFEKASGDETILGTKVNLDVDTKMLGMIFHAPISRNVDVVLGLAILQGELKASTGGATITTDNMEGQQASIGMRMMARDWLEINAGVNQTFIGGSSDSNIMIGASGYLRNDVSLGISYSSNNDTQTSYFSVSKYF